MAGLLDWVDPAREWWKSRPEVIKGLLSGAYSMATDQATREAAMARLPKPFDRSVTGEQMMNNALNAGPSGLLGKIVYHGSPHKFDKFDASKIGTGEGSQAFGHGTYMADSLDIAKSYRKNLSAGSYVGPDDAIVDFGKAHTEIVKAASKAGLHPDNANRVAEHILTYVDTGNPLRNYLKDYELPGGHESPYMAALNKAKELIKGPNQGSLYKADLPDEWIPKMLDWDKPISEAMRQQISKPMMEKFGSGASQSSGEQILKNLAWEFKNAGSKNPHADAANFMRENGIPGVRYMDGGSRPGAMNWQILPPSETVSGQWIVKQVPNGNVAYKGASEEAARAAFEKVKPPPPTYNYVVFPGLEDKVKILERNGVPLGLLGAMP